ncbi:serine hydrolase domain-containing protein [Brachybacterium sacelli]|uniref:CubicO group peptidase (Beta-lactamase class C family) n=1 Tax=Brachybacterium sacelli TaxID=173364 RepID=A0ABS4X3B9_9MICO|nr:serine hydrolase domain-containing protein [Brachybacterium sacelli]MBP2382960.1 CubicO group peptidase (beta-lactamase class C family) [Brachybacterium sacelli]
MHLIAGPYRQLSLVRRILVLSIVIACLLGTSMLAAPRVEADPGARDYDAAAAEHFVSSYAERNGLAGAAYVVVEDGDVVTTGAAGDVQPDTPMSIGSLSKSFTAFSVLQQVDRGKIELDASITDYLPNFSVLGADPSRITVRMLLDHTSGLPNPLVLEPTGTLAGDVAGIADLSSASTPGTSYLYSNLNYRTLALLVQTVSGEPFDKYLDRHIFTPLGMDHTTSVLTVSDRQGLDGGSVSAYGFAVHLPELKASVGGAGGVISTAEDMGSWLAVQQAGGITADGTRLLSTDLVEQSHEKQPHAGTYAMGWQHTSTTDPARIGHDGELTKYSARQDLVPSNGYATAVLLNTFTPTISHPFEISTGLIDISEGHTPSVRAPTSTIIDLAIAVATLLVAALGMRGIMRARVWARERRSHRWWRRLLRLLPQAVMPALAAFVFFGLTAGARNPATPLDAFALWPAATTFILIAGIVGTFLITARLVAFCSSHSKES